MNDDKPVWDMLEKILFTPPARAGVGRGVRTDVPALHEFSPMYFLNPGSDDDAWFFHPDQINSPSLIWPMDFCVICDKRGIDDGKGWDGQIAQIQRVRSIEPKEVRGKVSKVYKHMVCLTNAVVLENEYSSAKAYFGWCNNQWVSLFPDDKVWNGKSGMSLRFEGHDPQVDGIIKMTQSIALRARYAWTVGFSIYDGPKIRVETDPSGIRELFKDRDKDPERDRRLALRNWVRDHWRVTREDAEASAYVRKHMRGRTEFKWNGFDCVVEPSQFDIEKNKIIREMKESGATVAELVNAARA